MHMDAASAPAETHVFQAEVAELLNLMVHSVYSETEIFLRELVSNASDACDKLRYEAIARPDLLAGADKLAIRLVPDKAAGTLVIADTGIGMDRQELIDNLGTVARSGTKAFLKGLAEAKEGASLIGQFGVGFYSAFMVADRIEVTSHRAGSGETWVWTSSGGAGFELAAASEEQAARVPRGTEVRLHLKEDAKKYLEPYELERLVRTSSDHILFPIELVDEKGEESRSMRRARCGSGRIRGQAGGLHPGLPLDRHGLRRARAHAPLQGRGTAVLRRAAVRARGAALRSWRSQPQGPDKTLCAARLHHRRRRAAAALAALRARRRRQRGSAAEYFARDAAEQSAGDADQERPGHAGREQLESTADKDAESYAKIWNAFGPVLKEGLYEDQERRGQLLALARFATTAGEGGLRSLKQYVADLKPNQTEIYYLVGESAERVKSNPKLEAARARGIEVLLLTDPIDAFWTMMPQDFDGKPLKSLSQGDVDFALVPLLDQAAEQKPASDEDAAVIKAVKDALAEQVSEVRASQRLTESASCLVASTQGRDRELERLLARQNRGTGAKPILELNMGHDLVKALASAVGEKRNSDVSDIAALLLDQAHILDGEVPADPAAFASDQHVRRSRPAQRPLAPYFLDC